MGCHAIVFVARSVARSRTPLYFCQLIAAIDNTIAQWYHPSSNLSRNFTAVLTRAHAHTSCFSFRGALRDNLLRKLHSVTGPQHQTSTTCSATFSTIAKQVAEKIAQCNRAFTDKNVSFGAEAGVYFFNLWDILLNLYFPFKQANPRDRGAGGVHVPYNILKFLKS